MRIRSNSGSLSQGPWDVVVIGAGAAGLMSSLELPAHLNVLLLNRNISKHSSSRWAQGGIAAVTRIDDSDVSHADDTFRAGAGLCDADAVQMFVSNAPKCVERLMSFGMEFDREDGFLSTTLEAAHTHRRVLHVKDRTGRALVEVLQERVEQRSNIYHCRGVRVTQLWVEQQKCCGVQVLDGSLLRWIPSRAVVLATGGGGHLFANTTNPAQASGEGVALAWNAGASIKDLEFVQFHPTALKLNGAPCFLISEALRGEGAILVDEFGNSPVDHLVGKDLAPRDQISRALCEVMRLQGVNHLSLDLKPIRLTHLQYRFPTIFERCKAFGLDLSQNSIPVAPAAHYWMGGVATDLNAQTDLPGLYAVGEAACTGLHGANRLASNSLMECLVFASQMASIQLDSYPVKSYKRVKFQPENVSFKAIENLSNEYLKLSIQELRKLIWKEAGVNRSFLGLKQALVETRKDFQETNNHPLLMFVRNQNTDTCSKFNEFDRKKLNLLLDLNNRQLTSLLLLEACLFRRESRGGHFRSDISSSLPYWKCHSIQKLGVDISTKPVNL